ncbi:MAG: HD domain-containing protein [Firmicutes bacterium]|nr:HD domain-containing protein [Bacillota bacterium]
MNVINPRKRFDLVKDPIHGYVRFTKEKILPEEKATEADLINSSWLQRLRHIHQLQTAWFVYPSADHTRFTHALGVMELAGEFARVLYEPFYMHNKGKLNGEVLPSINYVVEAFRLAGLLHDVGHGPFTHLLDDKLLVKDFGITHEDISAAIIKNVLVDIIRGIKRSPEGFFEEELDVELICNLIKKGNEEKLEGIWRPLHQIIRGAYDADKMDFLLRDALLCGQGGMVYGDIKRLMQTTFLSSDGLTVFIHHSSLPLLLNFIKFRQHMLEVVYYHRTVRAIEFMIAPTIKPVIKTFIAGNPLDNLDYYMNLTEYVFFARLGEFEKGNSTQREISAIWKQVFERKIHWKLLDERSIFIHSPQELHRYLRKEELENRIRAETGLSPGCDFIIDSPSVETPSNIFALGGGTEKDRICLYYSEGRHNVHTMDRLALALHIPIKALHYRLYVDKEVPKKLHGKLSDEFCKNISGTDRYNSSSPSSF